MGLRLLQRVGPQTLVSTLNPLHVGLQSYWKLDEASGTATDAHSTNHLSDVNTVTGNPGKAGTSRQFTYANSEYLTVPSNSMLQTGDIDFTIAGWVYLDGKSANQAVVGKWTGAPAGEYLLFYNPGTDRFRFIVCDTSQTNYGFVDAAALGSPATGTWYFIVAWHDAATNTVNIQVNNGTVNSASHPYDVQVAATAFRVGATGAFGQEWDGRIDELGLWKRLLTPAERTQLYNLGSGVTYPTLTAPPPPFTPSALPGLQLWLSANSGTYQDAARTIPVTSHGFPVGGWADQSGLGNHASQSTALSRPTLFLTAVHTQPVLRFDGIDDALQIASVAGLQFTTAATLFMVVDVGAEGVSETLLSKGNLPADPDWIWDIGVSATEDGKMSLYNGTAFSHGTAGIVQRNTFYVLELAWDGATLALLASGVDGGVVSTATPWATSTEPLWIGSQGSGAVNLFSGGIAEIVCYNTALSASDRGEVRAYLMERYGLPGTATPLPAHVLYYNGNPTENLNFYQIGRAVASPSQDTRFQRVWPGDPVLGPGTAGAWDDVHVKDPWVMYDGGAWKMWYAGRNSARYQIGYATSADGIVWTKHASNPIIPVGAGGTWDSSGITFPIVYKDLAAVVGKRWRMLYSGQNAGGVRQIGYAYSADGVTWTKGSSNPVVTVGAGGSWESQDVIGGALAKVGGTYYLYYEGKTVTAFPLDAQGGLATFTDFEGVYTKHASNPVLPRHHSIQILAGNLLAGTTTVTVASTAAFVAGEVLWITNGTDAQQVAIASITDAAHLELAEPAHTSFLTSGPGAYVQSFLISVFPRTVYKDGSTWRMWLTPYQVGYDQPESESSYYATSPDGVVWTYAHASSPPFPLPAAGLLGAWDARASENPMVAMDAATYTPVTYPVTTSPLLTDLVSYWKLDESSGTRNDSHSTNHLTDNNTVTSNPGKQGTAAQFTAANTEYLSVLNNASLQSGDFDFTIACWVYFDSVAGEQPFLLKWDSSIAGWYNWAVDYYSSAFQFLVSPDGSGAPGVSSSFGAASTGTWYFVVCWHDSVANTINIQVNNGTPSAAAQPGGAYAGTASITVGRNSTNGSYFSGRVDEVGYWTRVLTPAERTQLWNSGAGVTYPAFA